MTGTSSGRSNSHGGRGTPLPSAAAHRFLRLQAEAALGFLLVARHRSPRMAAVLGGVLLLLSLTSGESAPDTGERQRGLVLVAGVVSVVATSRLLAPGGAVAAARHAAAAWWVIPAGRLAGSLLFTAPLVLLGAGVLFAGAAMHTAVRACAVALVFAAALGSLTMALAPVTGASAAGALGVLLVLFGLHPPSAMHLFFESLPPVRSLVVLAWNTLPLPWRAAHWLERGSLVHAAVFAAWIVMSVAMSAWVVSLPAVSARPARYPA